MTNNQKANPSTVPVLIVGGGPVGLALAADLGWRGIECLLVGRGDGEIFHPRANTVNSRSMEFCRRWGIAENVRNAGAPTDFPLDILYVTSLQGYEIARIDRPSYGGSTPLPTTPERSQRCNQIFFDPILRDLANSFPSVTLRYQCRFEAFVETDDGVVATLCDVATDRTETIQAEYLVACCGGQSRIPKDLGVQWEGTPVLSNHVNVFLRIPELWNNHDKGKAAFYFFVDPKGGNQSLIELDGDTLWRLGLDFGDKQVALETLDIDSFIKRWIGPEIRFEIVSALPWTCRSLVADNWHDGRIFLAGDAVHQHSPQGGFGMNTGLGDAVNLSWKLAAALEGWAGPGLLDSYQAERQPVARRIVRQATDMLGDVAEPEKLAVIDAPGYIGERIRREVGLDIVRDRTQIFVSDGLVLGYLYDQSPIVWADGTPTPEELVSEYIPTSRPGSRAPHAWISNGKSTIDLFGKNYVLLSFSGALSETSEFISAAASCAMPLNVIELNNPEIAALYEQPLVLVRPDGHVSWRGNSKDVDPQKVIDTVRGARFAG